MKEERLAILSMVEKGIITVEEAERLFVALNTSEKNDFEKLMEKTGEKLNALAKTVGETTEKLISDAKPMVKQAGEKLEKAVEDAKPAVKKAADTVAGKAEEIKEKIKERKNAAEEKAEDIVEEIIDEADLEESDFVEDVTIIPVEKTEE